MAIIGVLITILLLLAMAGAILLGIMYLLASLAVKVERRKYG